MIQKKLIILFSLLLLLPVLSPPVSAYLDPGFGSMVWQMLAAVLFGIAFTLKIYWIKIKNLFSGKKTEQTYE
jgi:hypothetical protein